MITQSAANAIRAILETAQVPDEGGIRISVAREDGTQPRLELSLSEAPMAGDAVVEEEGANVFLDELASVALDDKSLDAQIEGDQISFGIVEREEPSA